MEITSLLVRDLPLAVKSALRLRALAHQRSLSEEVRQVLTAAALPAPKANKAAALGASLGQRIHARFAALGGVELPQDTRRTWRALPKFEAPKTRARR